MMYVFLRRFSHYSPSQQHRPGKGCLFQDGVLDLLVSHVPNKKTLWKTNLAMEDPPCYSLRSIIELVGPFSHVQWSKLSDGKRENELEHHHAMKMGSQHNYGTSPCYENGLSSTVSTGPCSSSQTVNVCLPEGIRSATMAK